MIPPTHAPFRSRVVSLGLAALIMTGLGGVFPGSSAAADTVADDCQSAVKCRLTNEVLQSDLTVQSGSAWLEVHPGTSVLHFVLVNQGRRGTGPFEVDLDVTPDNADGGRVFVATLPGLGPGASVPLTAGSILPSDWLATGHFRGFVVV